MEVRRQAASAVYATHDERARGMLLELMGDKNQSVASSAEHWLDNLDRDLARRKQGEQ